MPMMPFSGVRISWLAIARKRDLARLAASAWSRASVSARSLSVRSVTSRPTLCISAGAPASLRDQAFAPGDPARAERSVDLLVVNPRAVGFERGVALFEHLQRRSVLPISSLRGNCASSQ